MKIIGMDNLDRDTMAEFVLCRLPSGVSKEKAQAMAEVLNGSTQEYYYEAVEDDKPLSFPSWWEPEDCNTLPTDPRENALLSLLKDLRGNPGHREWNGIEEHGLLEHFIGRLSGKI